MSQLAALVARRLCHDLAGPAGAIATVVEMLGDSAAGAADPELLSLLADSSSALLTTLRLHRFVLGGGDASDYRACLRAWVATREDVELRWVGEHQLAPAPAALLLGLAMIAAEAAPGAATLTIGENSVSVAGARLSLDPQIAAALGRAVATTPKGALAALLCQAALGQGWRIEVDVTPTRLELVLAQRSITKATHCRGSP